MEEGFEWIEISKKLKNELIKYKNNDTLDLD